MFAIFHNLRTVSEFSSSRTIHEYFEITVKSALSITDSKDRKNSVTNLFSVSVIYINIYRDF